MDKNMLGLEGVGKFCVRDIDILIVLVKESKFLKLR